MVIRLAAMVCGADDAEAVTGCGSANAAWIAPDLDQPHQAPSQDVNLANVAGLDTRKFEGVFLQWARLPPTRMEGPGVHIDVYGKSARGRATATTPPTSPSHGRLHST